MDYPSNSDAARSNRSRISEVTRTHANVDDPIAHGVVKRPNVMSKLFAIFIKRSFEDAFKEAIEDRLIPAIMDGAYNAISDTVGIMFYGDSYEAPRRDNHRSDRRDYSRGSRRESKAGRDEKRDYNTDDYHDRNRRELREASRITYETKGEALDVIDSMWEVLDRDHVVTVAYLYEASGIKTKNYTLDNYGWTSLNDARPTRNMDGTWKISFPRPLPIE